MLENMTKSEGLVNLSSDLEVNECASRATEIQN